MSFYPLLSLFLQGNKVEQRDKEVRRLVSTTGRPTKLKNSLAVCHKTLFPETK